jgi:hypothetical protein
VSTLWGCLCSLRARSALDGVSWVQGGLVEGAVGRELAAATQSALSSAPSLGRVISSVLCMKSTLFQWLEKLWRRECLVGVPIMEGPTARLCLRCAASASQMGRLETRWLASGSSALSRFDLASACLGVVPDGPTAVRRRVGVVRSAKPSQAQR